LFGLKAEVALLVVDCGSRAFEETRFGTYGSACFLYGIRKVIVAMNKWDQRCLHFDGKIFEVGGSSAA
jgi:translation elongation factor EF-1alpha